MTNAEGFYVTVPYSSQSSNGLKGHLDQTAKLPRLKVNAYPDSPACSAVYPFLWQGNSSTCPGYAGFVASGSNPSLRDTEKQSVILPLNFIFSQISETAFVAFLLIILLSIVRSGSLTFPPINHSFKALCHPSSALNHSPNEYVHFN